MAKEILILLLVGQIISCENTTGQYRHDKTHHQKQQQQFTGYQSGEYISLLE